MNPYDENTVAIIEGIVERIAKRAFDAHRKETVAEWQRIHDGQILLGAKIARLNRTVFGEETQDEDGGMVTQITLMNEQLNWIVRLIIILIVFMVVNLIAIIALAIKVI